MKIKTFVLMLSFIFVFPTSCFAKDSEIAIYVNKKEFRNKNEPIICDDRLMLSLRDINKLLSLRDIDVLLDSEIIWQQETNTAVISTSQGKMYFTADRETVLLEQGQQTQTKKMDTRPVIVNDRMYIPARFVSEISGLRVSWDSEGNKVDIVSLTDDKAREQAVSSEEREDGYSLKREDRDSEEREDRYSASDSKTERIVPTSEIHYSTETQNVDEIAAYIKNNLDKDFELANFEVKTNMANAYLGSEIISTSISMYRKNGNFVTEDGYYITVENGIVDNIFIKGNPTGSINNADKEMVDEIDEEWLKELALKNTVPTKGYEVTKQRILKKYDGEPYYVVVTEFESSDGMGYLDTFEYRIK